MAMRLPRRLAVVFLATCASLAGLSRVLFAPAPATAPSALRRLPPPAAAQAAPVALAPLARDRVIIGGAPALLGLESRIAPPARPAWPGAALLLAVLGSATVAVLPIGASQTIQEITTLNELMSTVQSLGTSKKSNHPDGDLLCIKFHARRCRSCRAFAPKFSALARKYSERAHFFEMEASDELAEALQVKKTPCLQFYRYPKGHLSTIVCEPHVWPELGKHVEAFLEDGRLDASGVEIEEGLLQEAKKLVDEDNLEMAEQEKDDGFSP